MAYLQLEAGKRSIIMFDGICNLCDGFVNFVYNRDNDNRFVFCPLQSALGQKLLVKYDLPTEITTIVFIEEETDLVWIESSAVLRICGYLASPYHWLYGCLAVPPIIRNLVYRFIAYNRYSLFGIKDSEACGFNPGLRKRFIDYAKVVEYCSEGVKDV